MKKVLFLLFISQISTAYNYYFPDENGNYNYNAYPYRGSDSSSWEQQRLQRGEASGLLDNSGTRNTQSTVAPMPQYLAGWGFGFNTAKIGRGW